METTKQIERRRHRRYAALMTQERHIVIQYETESVTGDVVNLSASGVLIGASRSRGQFEIGTRISLFLDNGGQVFELKATVIRTGDKQIAVHFAELTAADKRDIRDKIIRMQMLAARLAQVQLG